MRKLRIFEHMSLDGVIQNTTDDDDFPYNDWTVAYRSAPGRDMLLAMQGESFDLLLGRRVYDAWSGFWPKAPSSPMSERINAAKKYVVTHRPQSLAWGPFEGLPTPSDTGRPAGTPGLEPDLIEAVRRIKAQDGPDLIVWGSSTLTSTLLEHGLVDELVLCVYPVLLGKGSACSRRVLRRAHFRSRARRRRRLASSSTPTRSHDLLGLANSAYEIIYGSITNGREYSLGVCMDSRTENS